MDKVLLVKRLLQTAIRLLPVTTETGNPVSVGEYQGRKCIQTSIDLCSAWHNPVMNLQLFDEDRTCLIMDITTDNGCKVAEMLSKETVDELIAKLTDIRTRMV